MFCLNQKGWKETETIETGDSVAFMLSFKGKLKEGEVLQVVERNIDLNDSIVTSIQIPSIYHQTHRHLFSVWKWIMIINATFNMLLKT